jgi:hypothetical protein
MENKVLSFGGKEKVGVLGVSVTLEILWLVCGGEMKGLSLEQRDMVEQC